MKRVQEKVQMGLPGKDRNIRLKFSRCSEGCLLGPEPVLQAACRPAIPHHTVSQQRNKKRQSCHKC